MWPAIIAGGASIAGGLLSKQGQESANDTSASIAAQNNATAMELANTAHQREVKDLKAAGLNPILSATGGSGASSPSLQAPPVQNTMAGLSNSASSLGSTIADVASKMAQIDNISADTANKRVQSALLTNQNTGQDIANKQQAINLSNLPEQSLLSLSSARSKAETDLQNSAIANIQRQRGDVALRLDQLQVHSAQAAANLADIDAKYYLSGAGTFLRQMQLGGKAADDATSPVRHIIPLTR